MGHFAKVGLIFMDLFRRNLTSYAIALLASERNIIFLDIRMALRATL
jgi:hypothetical protein